VLVVDSNVAIVWCGMADGFRGIQEDLIAPPLMWSEFRSSLHEGLWRGEVVEEDADATLGALRRSPIRQKTHPRLGDEAWRVANELGWAKTYDAEYVALARLLACRLVTLDGRLRRGADRLGFVIGPTEL
jgi:predicted nucleic acid-binding protein